MKNLCKSVLALWAIGTCLGLSAPAQADSVGPYYATPSWDQTLPAATRFIVLSNFANTAAVLDRETGLVWEKAPSTTVFNWFDASSHCINSSTGGRTGWRLPAIPELLSLVDRTQSNPSLPSGHPFSVPSSDYWSATAFASIANFAWVVNLRNGLVDGGFKSSGTFLFLAWCVRGGPGADSQ